MSVREYVGARYVPLFLGEWNNQTKYEPLSVVSYKGASYTSRQYVPIGIDIEDANYWILSGNYNAQVEAYRLEVRAITPFDTTPTQNSTVGVTSGGVYDAITEISDAVDTLESSTNTKISSLESEIATLKAKLANVNTLSEGTTYGVLKSSGFIHD